MKFEDVFNRPRLSVEEEGIVPELERVALDPSSAATSDLLEAYDAAVAQYQQWSDEEDILSQNINRLDAGYDLALKRNRGEYLDGFKGAKNKLKGALDRHSEDADKIGVDSVSKAVNSPRLRNTEEVKEYLENREKLVNLVKGIAKSKKGLRQSDFDSIKNLSFRAEKRESSIEAVKLKQREITGSQAALSDEVKNVLAELTKRAEESLRKEVDSISIEISRKLNTRELKGIDDVNEVIPSLMEIVLAKNAVEFGIEASDSALKKVSDVINISREKARDFKRGFREDSTFRGYEIDKAKAEESLEAISNKEHELEVSMMNDYGLPLDKIPLNIQIRTADGYQGLHSEEGEVVAYAFIYDENGEYKKAEKELEQKTAELLSLKEGLEKERERLQSDMKTKPASFFNFPLKIEYENRGDDLLEMEKKIASKQAEVDHMSDDLGRLQSEMRSKVKKVPIDISGLVSTIELVNYYYIHENYGRGYELARSKSPMQTIGDFFRIFKEKRLKEIDESQRLQKEYAEKHNFETYEALAERKKKRRR